MQRVPSVVKIGTSACTHLGSFSSHQFLSLYLQTGTTCTLGLQYRLCGWGYGMRVQLSRLDPRETSTGYMSDNSCVQPTYNYVQGIYCSSQRKIYSCITSSNVQVYDVSSKETVLLEKKHLKFMETNATDKSLSAGTHVMYKDGEHWKEGVVHSNSAEGVMRVRSVYQTM